MPFTDLTHTIRFPVDIDEIQQSQLAIKTYEPSAHMRRRVVLTGVKLSEWLAAQVSHPPAGCGTYLISH